MLGLLRAALALSAVWLLGALLLSSLGLRRRRWPLQYAQPAMDFAVGAALLATLWTCAALLAMAMRPHVVWAALLLLAIPAGVRIARKRPAASERAEEVPPSGSRRNFLSWIALALLVIVCFGLFARAYSTNLFWDGRYIWGFKAKAMFADGRLDRQAFSNLARYRYTHADYPLAVPAAEAWVYQVMGHVDERRAKLVGAVYALGVIALLAGYLRRRMALPWAIGLSLLACQVPVFAYHAASGGADVPQACCFLAAGLMLADWTETGRREDLRMAALMFGAGALVKAEGLSIALGGALLLALGCWWRRREMRRGEIALGFLLVALPYLPWAVLRAVWGIPSLQLTTISARPLTENLERLATVGRRLFEHAISWPRWEAVWLLIALGLLAYLLRRPRERPLAMLWALVAWQLAVYVVIYVVSPYNVAEHLTTSLDRVLLHLVPLATAAAAASLVRTSAQPAGKEGRR